MIKFMFCMRRLPHLTREEFQRYWHDEHPRAAGPRGAAALGVSRYVQVHPFPEEVNEPLGASRGCEADYDGVAELWFESRQAMDAAMDTEEGRAAIRALMEDERKFVDWARSSIFIAEEKQLYP